MRSMSRRCIECNSINRSPRTANPEQQLKQTYITESGIERAVAKENLSRATLQNKSIEVLCNKVDDQLNVKYVSLKDLQVQIRVCEEGSWKNEEALEILEVELANARRRLGS
jgi:hypothetical protein